MGLDRDRDREIDWDHGSPRDEGRLFALQDHLADVTQRLARSEKQREEQTKEANQARGQLEVMRSRLAEYQRRVEAEEDASDRVVTERDQKSGVIAELREQIAAQRQRIAELQAQRDQLINEANTVKTENKKHKKLLKEVHDQHATTQEHLQKLQVEYQVSSPESPLASPLEFLPESLPTPQSNPTEPHRCEFETGVQKRAFPPKCLPRNRRRRSS